MPLADDALAEDGAGDGDSRSFREGQQLVLQAKAVDLHVGDDHGRLGGRDALGRFGHRLGQGGRIAGGLADGAGLRSVRHDMDQVPRQLDVSGPLVPPHVVQHAVDAAEGGVGVVQLGVGPAEAVKDFRLSLKVLDLVVQKRVMHPLAKSRRAADDDHRRFLRVGPGDRIAQAQATHAIRHAHRADAVDAGVGVGRKARAVLARAAYEPQRAFFQHAVERQHVIARNAEHVADAIFAQTANQVLADRFACGGSCHRSDSFPLDNMIH